MNFRMSVSTVIAFFRTTVFLILPMAFFSCPDGVCAEVLIPLDSRWEHPQYVTFRPADGGMADVNPPRISWPYKPHAAAPHGRDLPEGVLPLREFTLQICGKGDFADPRVNIATEYNFYNALPVLEPGKWYWRVGYRLLDSGSIHHWSAVRSFTVGEGTPEWDRTVILEAADIISRRPRPYLGPADGNWGRVLKEIGEDGWSSAWLSRMERLPQTLKNQEWWDDFPETDLPGENQYSARDWDRAISRRLAEAAFYYRLTEDPGLDPDKIKSCFLKIAAFPKGGQTSPEYHYTGPKWGTRVVYHMALFYDWWHDLFTEEEREKMLDAISWRLEAILLERASWKSGEGMLRSSVAVWPGSHSWENFYWAAKAVLLTAGDLPLAADKVEPVLHYLAGVTNVSGPDEGWNQGLGYGVWKTSHPLEAAMLTAIVLPELNIHRSPVFHSWGRWHAHLLPMGTERLPFGDHGDNILDGRPRFTISHRELFRRLSLLSGEPAFAHRYLVIKEKHGDSPSVYAWLDHFLSRLFEIPEPTAKLPETAHFPEAGWVMASSHGPSDRPGFDEGAGMIFQVRPRGGFNHSYRAENTFAWQALGQSLSSPGASLRFGDDYARHTMSHNGIMIDGEGQEWVLSHPRLTPRTPARFHPRYPFAGRLLAYGEGDGYVYWAGDATNAYQTVPGLQRVHRHVVFVDDKWFAVFDDLAVSPGREPARFSYLFHVAPEAPGELDEENAVFRFRMEDVNARVAFANDPASMEMVNHQERDGFKNPVTGEDIYPEILPRLERFGRPKVGMHHNIWATNREPAREWQFLTALTAQRADEEEINLDFPSSSEIVAEYPDGTRTRVMFETEAESSEIHRRTPQNDIYINAAGVRGHAERTDPCRLPVSGLSENLRIDGSRYNIEWLLREEFPSGWMLRWVQEGKGLVKAGEGVLEVSGGMSESEKARSVLWSRPEMPENLAFRARVTFGGPGDKIKLYMNAGESEDERIFFGRTGDPREYEQISGYAIRLSCHSDNVAGSGGEAALFRNPGAERLSDGGLRLRAGRDYELLATVYNGRIRFYIDGVKKFDYIDTSPHSPGQIGLGVVGTNLRWEEIEIGRLR